MAYPGWKLASRFLCCGGRREKRQRQTHKYTDTHRHTHTTPHTHTIRLRAHCSSVHTPILSPIFGTRFAQTNTAFWGREDGGRGGSFLFCFLLPISCPPPPTFAGRMSTWETKGHSGHVQKTPVSLCSLCSPAFCC